jgi:serine phosphatase RsbU (regulator of sigma subunit)
VLYTDGVTEVRYEGEQFGVDRLRAVVSAAVDAEADADAMAQHIVEASIAFSRSDVTPDDLAVFTVRARVGDPASG